MLEKFGLPAKPSLKGNTWVVDASHCQGCSSQFTFINRKHHCRRCGGLFCNSCTNQRRILRGQGDSPVRICEPCKKLEEAARLELRSGNKSRAGKGATKLPSNPEEDLLNQILNNETNDPTSDATSSSSSYNIVGPTQNTTTTPEQLREQAIEEKNKYKTLKSQGKSVEAMKAFKKSKEFEREASALELNLRKNRIKALKEDSGTSLRKNNVLIGEKDELANELKELGWSDIEVKDGVKKVGPVSIESELISLLGENTEKKKIGNNNNNPDKKRVIAHKKKALELKREGNLIEAKEELKKAKILEKKIEELELLGEDDEESDDELADLIRSVENEKKDEFSINREIDFNFDFNFNEINEENDVEIDDMDEDDPEIVAALSSFGWVEESQSQSKKESQSLSKKVGPTKSRVEIQRELLALKKKARVLRSEGKVDEADAELAKCKVLENMLEEINDVSKIKQPSIENEDVTEQDMIDPSYELMLNSLGWKDDNEKTKDLTAKSSKRSRVVVQRELLGIKKKALGLKREGKVNEAEAELAKGKILEKELEEIDNNKADVSLQPSISNKQPSTVVNNEEEDVTVTDQEMNDPDYLAVLNGFGWKDDDNEKVKDQSAKKSKSEIQRELLGLKRKSFSLRKEGKFDEAEEVLKRAKVLEIQLEEFDTEKKVLIEPELSEIVKEVNLPFYPSESKSDLSVLKSDILARKRKAVMLKKEGRIAEAKEELIQAKLLEKQLETTTNSSGSHISSVVETSISAKNPNSSGSHVSSVVEKKEETNSSGSIETSISAKKPVNDESSGSHITSAKKPLSSRERFKMQQQSLNHKRTSLKLRKEGRIEEAEAETLLAKALEAQLEESSTHDSTRLSENNDVSVEDFLDPQLMSALKGLGIPDIGLSVPEGKKTVEKIDERKQLEEEIRAEKVKAVNLKKSGKTKEALDALRRAKLIEKKLNLLLSE